MIMNVNNGNEDKEYEEEHIKKEDYVEYSIEKNDYEESDNDSTNETSMDSNLYKDGEDKNPKKIIIIGGIVLLLIIILVFAISCVKSNKKDSNNTLSSIKVSNSEFLPDFSPNILEYNVISTKDIVTLTCITSSKKATVSGCNKRLSLKDGCVEQLIKVTSQSGSTKKYQLNICKQDENAPIIKDILLEPSKYTNSKVTVTVEVEDISELNGKAYSFDGGTTWQEKNSYDVTENKTLKIQVKNKTDVKSAVMVKKIELIDKTVPNIVVKGSVSSGTETSSNVKLTANVTPDATISGYKYQWYKGTSAIGGATSSSYTATSSGTYMVKVTTGAGNSKDSNKYDVKIKASSSPTPTPTPTPKPAATISINDVTGNATSWTKNNVTLSINASASEGLNNSAYSFDNGNTWQTSKSKVFSSNQTVYIVVRDVKGNKSQVKNVSISKIDKTTPTVTISGGSYIGDTLTINPNPSTTPSGYKYQWYDKNNSAISGATNKTFVPTSSGTYYAKAITGAGNSSTYAQKTISKRISPTVSLLASETSGVWTNQNVQLTVNIVNGSISNCTWYKDGIYTGANGQTVEIKQTGVYKAIVTTTTGEYITTNSYYANIDKIKPYTTRLATSQFSNVDDVECYEEGNPKPLSNHDYRTTKNMGCIINTTKKGQINILDEDAGGSGLDYCEIVWQPNKGSCTKYGSSNDFTIDFEDANFTGINTISWNRDITTKCGTGATLINYVRRCHDKAGNVSSVLANIISVNN